MKKPTYTASWSGFRCMFSTVWPFLLLVAIAFLTACASVSVYQADEKKHLVASLPKKIYVLPFETSGSRFKVDRDGARLVRFRDDLIRSLQRETVIRINKAVLPAEKAHDLLILPSQNAWAVSGRIEQVEQGSRALRTVVGFGIGRTLLSTKVIVYDLSEREPRAVLSFKTTGGSNWDGGAVAPLFGPVPWLAAVSAGAGIAAGLSTDIRRTAREITAAISNELAKRGAMTIERPMAPKRAVWED